MIWDQGFCPSYVKIWGRWERPTWTSKEVVLLQIVCSITAHVAPASISEGFAHTLAITASTGEAAADSSCGVTVTVLAALQVVDVQVPVAGLAHVAVVSLHQGLALAQAAIIEGAAATQREAWNLLSTSRITVTFWNSIGEFSCIFNGFR